MPKISYVLLFKASVIVSFLLGWRRPFILIDAILIGSDIYSISIEWSLVKLLELDILLEVDLIGKW